MHLAISYEYHKQKAKTNTKVQLTMAPMATLEMVDCQVIARTLCDRCTGSQSLIV